MSEVIKSIVREYSDKEGLGLTDEQLVQLDTYASMLVKTNEVMNLTNITDDEGDRRQALHRFAYARAIHKGRAGKSVP